MNKSFRAGRRKTVEPLSHSPNVKKLSFTENPLRTRDDVQRLARDLVTPVLPHFSPGCAQVLLGANRAHYGDPAGLMEGFLRPLWGLAPLAAGGGAFENWDFWQRGLDAGTNPEHAEYWGAQEDFDQRSVEAGALGFALALAPHDVWDRLSSTARARVAMWLRKINEVRLVDNNWLFFRVLVNVGLRHVGEADAPERVEADLTRIDQFYLGDGWYSDGKSAAPSRDGRLGDYYVPMAFHFYGLLYARLEGGVDPVRAARYVERARIFAQEFIHWFAADGAALPFGRSLTYRFAQVAFWGALAFAPVEAFPWPVIKGIYLRHLRWWLRQPLFSETGLLTIGYAYPNLIMAESYNSSGSPYWAMKAFLPLALPQEHPFWQADEAPLPPRPAVRTVRGAGFVMSTIGAARDVVALNAGQPVENWPRHAPQKYSKFAYSNRFGFCVPVSCATPQEGGFDSMLALSDDESRFRVREHCYDMEVRDGVAYSRWQPWPDVEVKTRLIAAPDGHLRIHQVKTSRKLWSAECGFAASYTRRNSLVRSAPEDGRAEVRTPAGVSSLLDFSGARQGECVEVGANSHLLTSLSAMPVLRGVHEAGEFWLACLAKGDAPDTVSFANPGEFVVRREEGAFHILRNGAKWWTSRGDGCGESSEARLRELDTRV